MVKDVPEQVLLYVQARVVETPVHALPVSVHPAAQLPVEVDAQSSITASQSARVSSAVPVTAAHATVSAATGVPAVSAQEPTPALCVGRVRVKASSSPRSTTSVVDSSRGVVTDVVADTVGVVTDVVADIVFAVTVPVVVIEPVEVMLCVVMG